jgi:hypothetical protein
VPRSQRYELTDHGRMIAVLLTKTHTRIVNPSLAELDPRLPDPIARTTALGKDAHVTLHLAAAPSVP